MTSSTTQEEVETNTPNNHTISSKNITLVTQSSIRKCADTTTLSTFTHE